MQKTIWTITITATWILLHPLLSGAIWGNFAVAGSLRPAGVIAQPFGNSIEILHTETDRPSPGNVNASTEAYVDPELIQLHEDGSILIPNLCQNGDWLDLALLLTPFDEPDNTDGLHWQLAQSGIAPATVRPRVCAMLKQEGNETRILLPELHQSDELLAMKITLELYRYDLSNLYWTTVAFEQPQPALTSLYVAMDDVDLDDLYQRDPNSNDRLPATARIGLDGPEIELDGLRFRGSSSRYLPKKSFNIRFRDGQDILFGSSRMNANAMYTDASMMREHLAWGMWAELNRPASRARYLDLWLNNTYEGLYLHIERVDADLLRAAGLNPAGTLVRDKFRDFRFKDARVDVNSAFGFALSEIPEPERADLLAAGFSSRGSPRWDLLAELIIWVERSEPGDTFAQEFAARFDSEVFIDWLAIHYLIGDIDSFADDYWLYLDHDDSRARWIVIPWDKDLSFGSHYRPDLGTANDYFAYEYPVAGGWGNRLLEMFMDTPQLKAKLAARMHYLMHEVFTEKYFADQIEVTWQIIGDSVARQPAVPDNSGGAFVRHPRNHHSTQGVPDLHMETLQDFITLRYAYLAEWINPTSDWAWPYTAVRNLDNASAGDVIRFTDNFGWTIARLELLNTPPGSGQIRFRVHANLNQSGINRTWILNSDLQPFEAILTLYYRNEHAFVLPGENWYTGGPLPVGNQWDLGMFELNWPRFENLSESRVNPFSNKVEAQITVQPHIMQRFVIGVAGEAD